MHTEIVPITAKISPGTSQLATDDGVALIPEKTSPGAARTFIKRPASEVAATGGAAGGGSGVGGMGSTFNPVLSNT
jgi:hypothetical protein